MASELLYKQCCSGAGNYHCAGSYRAFIAEKQRGACRVHGGGFAGVIMAMLPNDLTDEYIRYIEGLSGGGLRLQNEYPSIRSSLH